MSKMDIATCISRMKEAERLTQEAHELLNEVEASLSGTIDYAFVSFVVQGLAESAENLKGGIDMVRGGMEERVKQ